MIKRSFQWGSPIFVIAMLLISMANVKSPAASGEESNPKLDTWVSQLPTPVLNPNKVTPTPAPALPTVAPTQAGGNTTNPGLKATPTPAAETGGNTTTDDSCLPIQYGQTVQGSIDNTNWGITYCFTAAAGDVVTADMAATTGNLDGFLAIYDPATDQITVSNDDRVSGNTNPLIENHTIATAGNYVLLVSRYDLEAGTTAGGYSLTFNIGTASNTVNGGAGTGVNVTCNGGSNIINGVEVIVVQMRPGFTYHATAIGINGFDPVLAVLDETGQNGLCNDDDSIAAVYSANLPSSGFVPSSSTSARVDFSQNSGDFANISIVVGGFNGASGEFILMLEGMAVTSADNLGDPFAVMVSSNLVASNVPMTLYMIANTNSLDPLLSAVDNNMEFYLADDAGNNITCDDAGSLCWGASQDMTGSSITIQGGRALPGGPKDAMLQLSLTDLQTDKLTFLMSSYNGQTGGDYTVVFHMGIANQ